MIIHLILFLFFYIIGIFNLLTDTKVGLILGVICIAVGTVELNKINENKNEQKK